MLRRSAKIALATWNHALECMRLAEGMPVQEVVELIDRAALLLVEVRALTEGASGVFRTLNDLVALHERFRERLEVFNRHSVIPLSGPGGLVDPEDLLRGRASAMYAILSGRAAEAFRILERALRNWDQQTRGSPYHLMARNLSARCLHELGDRRTARRLLEQLLDECVSSDLHALRCEIGDLHAQTHIGTGEEPRAFRAVDDLLRYSSNHGLALRWTNLMCTRAELLAGAGDDDAARACFRLALLGPREGECVQLWPEACSFPLPSLEGYRWAFMRAQRILSSRSDSTTTAVDEALRNTNPPPIQERSKYRGRRMPPRVEGEVARRAQLHAQALQALREFHDQRKPFVLYLRKFDITVLHRSALLGPGLLEVGLYDILPESYNMLTIQDSTGTGSYTGTGHAFDRTVPALRLEDDNWQEVARFLIAHAAAIVSECLMLSEGVRAELEIIDCLGRNNDTLVVLPPSGGYLQSLSDDPLVGKFPNTIAAEVLRDIPLTEVPFVARLLEESQAL
jgi:tetratricopeptide (TPR) repeat protein